MTLLLDLETLDALWKQRQNPRDLNDLQRLLEALTRETQDLEARFELDWRASRLLQFQAMQRLESGDDKATRKAARKLFERGAERAQWMGSEVRGEGRFWHAVNSLEFARLGPKIGAFWAVRAARGQLREVLEWDEAFHFAGAHRVLGRIAHLAPSRARGGLETAHHHFERALELCDNSTTRLYFAGLLEDEGNIPAAREQIEGILAAPDDESWRWEQARDRALAAQWLERN